MFSAIVVSVVVIAAILGVGRTIERWAPKTFEPSERWAFRFFFGAGTLGTSVWAVGQVSYGVVPIAFACGLGVLAWFAPGTPRWITGKLDVDAGDRGYVLHWPAWVAAAIGALAEPAGSIEHDGIAYHLLGPKVWLRDGFIRPVLDHVCTSYPAIWERRTPRVNHDIIFAVVRTPSR